jgi:hypothetical protein
MSTTPQARHIGRHDSPARPRRLVIALALCCVAWPAQAYIDPGSGMLLWQGLLAALGAVIVFVRHPLDTVKRWLERWRRK